jgi:hypothetical protein
VTVIDALQNNTWTTIRAAGGKARRPRAITRPTTRRRERIVVSAADLSRAMNQERE